MNAPLAELKEAHRGLINDLRRYDYNSIGQLVGALLTFPNFHASTLRLDVLAHLACMSCEGKRQADRAALGTIIGRHLADSPLCPMEDPVEDAFIGNVGAKFGNFRVFRGIEESGDFWLERALRPLPDEIPGPLQTTVKELRALLTLSDAVAERLTLVRYASGGGERGHRLVVPRWREVTEHADALRFTETDLQKLAVTSAQLEPFIFDDSFRSKLIAERLGHTHLDRHPLRKINGAIVLMLPHMVIPCVTRFFLERLKLTGFLGFYEMFLHQDQVNEWFGSLHNGLGFEPFQLELPQPPEGFPPLYQTVMSFDVGKYAHVLLLDGNIEANIRDCHGWDQFTNEQEKVFAKHMEHCAAVLRTQADFNGGMTLISRGGVGSRGFSIGLPNLGPDWAVHFATLSDWQTLARCDDMSALRLWRMWRHLRRAEAHGLKVMNNNGLLNLFAAWRANKWRFLLREMPIANPHKLLVVEIDFVTKVREEVSRAYDDHSCLAHDGSKWWPLQRHGARAYFREDKEAPVYVVQDVIREGTLLGVIKSVSRNWWIASQTKGANRNERGIVFQLWECVLNWMTRAIPVIERLLPQVPESSIWIEVEVLDIKQWSDEDKRLNSPEGVFPLCAINAEHRAIKITLPATFRHEFHVPENSAEVKMVAALLSGLERLAGGQIADHTKFGLLDEIFPNSEARFFHVVRTENWAQMLDDSPRPRPLFIPEEEHAQSLIGLADTIGDVPPDGFIKGDEPCLDYLQAAVVKLRERIETRLRVFDRASIVRACFRGLLELEKDAEHWSMTARSQLALHANQVEVLQLAEERRGQRDAASLTNRLLIETAMYACANNGGLSFTRSDHVELLAHMQNLVSTANHRDAISESFMPAVIRVFPNGELDVDDDFYVSVMIPYIRAKFADNFRAWAKHYERWFSGYQPEKDPNAVDALNQLEQPFVKEFGLTIDQLLTIPHRFGRHALKTKALILEFGDAALRSFLSTECELSAPAVDAFLSRFSLSPRRGWNKDLPPGVRDYDVFPWRFRRRLSFLMRPLIQISAGLEKRWLIFPPALDTSAKYLLSNVAAAAFPVEHFATQEMRQFWGDQVNRQGHRFTNEVADVFEHSGFQVAREVLMTALGVPGSEGDLGDVDVLAWRAGSPLVLAVECKRLRDATSVRDVVDRLNEYRGDVGDSLGKHLRRVKWLRQHPDKLKLMIDHSLPQIEIRVLLVTSDLVPMQFFSGASLKSSEVIPIDSLPQYLAAN